MLRVGAADARSGGPVRRQPFRVQPLIGASNAALRDAAQKVRYIWHDIGPRAALHGLPFRPPPVWPSEPDLPASRVATVAAEEGWVGPRQAAEEVRELEQFSL